MVSGLSDRDANKVWKDNNDTNRIGWYRDCTAQFYERRRQSLLDTLLNIERVLLALNVPSLFL